MPAHAEAVYEPATRTVRCITCPAVTEPVTSRAEPDNPRSQRIGGSGVAGSSARREHERRKARDEERLRDKWGPFGGIAVALSLLPACPSSVFSSGLAMAFGIAVLFGIVVLGPGAFSLDARFFGRREIIIPPPRAL